MFFLFYLFVFIILESVSEERSSRRAALEASLQEVLFQIIKFVNEKKDHVPPISEGVIYFPYEITVPRSALPSLYFLFYRLLVKDLWIYGMETCVVIILLFSTKTLVFFISSLRHFSVKKILIDSI